LGSAVGFDAEFRLLRLDGNGTVTDSARVRVLSALAPSVGDTSGMFKIKSLINNQPPAILHNPVCDPYPGNVDFFCKVTDDGAFSAPYIIWSTNDFATKDSLQLSSVSSGYSGRPTGRKDLFAIF
jgi:hypothetical protein